MSLNAKVFLIIIICILTMLLVQIFHSVPSNCADFPLKDKSGVNLFDYLSSYKIDTHNAMFTQEIISTGMYTDANYNNYWAIIEIPPDDQYLLKAWDNDQAYIAFESWLEGTSEWIVDNKYKISMYYYINEYTEELSIFYQNIWVGNSNSVSSIQPLPQNSKGKAIYIKYESILGSVLSLNNGNDLRFRSNYLTIQ